MATSEVSIKGYSEPNDGSRPVSQTVRSTSGAGKGNLTGICSDLYHNEWVFLFVFILFFSKLMLTRRCTRSFGVHVPVHLWLYLARVSWCTISLKVISSRFVSKKPFIPFSTSVLFESIVQFHFQTHCWTCITEILCFLVMMFVAWQLKFNHDPFFFCGRGLVWGNLVLAVTNLQ